MKPLTNPGNYKSKYNTHKYLRKVLGCDLRDKEKEVPDLDKFVEKVFPQAKCLPIPLDDLICLMHTPDKEPNKENKCLELSGEETEQKAKRTRKKKANKTKKKKKATVKDKPENTAEQDSPFGKWNPPVPVFSSKSVSDKNACDFLQQIWDAAKEHFLDDWEFKRKWSVQFAMFSVKTSGVNARFVCCGQERRCK